MSADRNLGGKVPIRGHRISRTKRFLYQKVIGLVAVLGVTCAAGCAGPQPITPPNVSELPTAHIAQGERDGLVLRAALLAKEQAQRLISVDVTGRSVMPVLFVMTNQTATPHLVLREHFSLRVDQLPIEPALPGRAATLLRDSSGVQHAAFLGWLVLGPFAIPSIHTAGKQEAAVVEANRELIFSQGHLPPGGTLAGYLFFEIPIVPAKIQLLELELQVFPGSAEDRIAVQLPNAYMDRDGR